MLHRIPYSLSQKTCFAGGLLDQRKLQIFRSGSWICHRAVYQMIHPELNIRAVMSLIRHVACWEPYSGRFENTKTSRGNFPSAVCAEAQQSVSHTECAASSLPAAVAGWCLRCLLWGLCPRYSSAWLWVSQSKPFCLLWQDALATDLEKVPKTACLVKKREAGDV